MPNGRAVSTDATPGINGRSRPRVHIDGEAFGTSMSAHRILELIRFKGWAVRPLKVVIRELGSERRETVRSLSVVGEGDYGELSSVMRGPGWTHRWCTGCYAKGIAG